MNWEEYIDTEQAKLDESARVLQTHIDESGLSVDAIEKLSQIDVEALDPELRQQLEMEGGLVLAQLKATKPVADATSYRQKRNVMAV